MQTLGPHRFNCRRPIAGRSDAVSVANLLLQAIHDEHPRVRAAAARVLGNVSSPRSIAALKHAATDEASPVQRNAVASLRRLRVDIARPDGPVRE
jgi:HEAT repeat protein